MLQDVLQTVHDHKDEMLVLLTFGSVCVALLTALLAPAVQMHIARLNASTSILTASRVKWIETMQADIADLIATIERAEFLNKSMAEIRKQFPELNDGQQEEFNRMHREYEERTFQRNKLSSLLGIKFDISPEKRTELFKAIEELADKTTGISTSPSAVLPVLKKVQDLTQEIVEDEWSSIERQVGRRRDKTSKSGR